ncbi:MAG: diguanylate cyclase, partial [Gammaproteobacteria bacterium]
IILLLVLLTALTLSGWLTLKHEEKNILAEIDQRGSDISRFVAKSLSFSVVGYDYHTIQLLLDEIVLSEDVGYARVISQKGNVMAEAGTQRLLINQPKLVIFNQDIKLEDEVVGKLVLGFSTLNTIKRLESKKYTLLKREAFIILMIAIGELIALSYFIIRPVSIMSNSLIKSVDDEGQMSCKDENGRIICEMPVISSDEFGQLATQFNNLGLQLNDANARLQSKVEIADKKLIETNTQLLEQSNELKRINEEFKRLSITDVLTGLYNRRQFQKLMQTELDLSDRYDETASIILIDIDHFKSINDKYGHPCGDKVLQETAALLKSQIRKTDSLCRIGGEEFATICRHADRNTASGIAEKLRSAIENLIFDCSDNKIDITISLGVATINQHDTDIDPETLYRNADIAVYHSKKTGRNRVTHFDDIPQEKLSII